MEPMAVAAANWQTPQPIIETLTFENERVNRYVWYAGERLPWPEIQGGYIERCRVTPVVPFLIWERITDVPEDMRTKVRRDWMDRSHTEAQYEVRPQGIFNSIVEQYSHLGVVELTALKGMEPQQVAALNLDIRFTPWNSDEMPKQYSEIEAHIQTTLNDITDPVLQSIGREMLASIRASRAYDEQFVDLVESQKELKYSHPAFRALDRLGRRRRDKALNDMAAADLAAKNAKVEHSNDSSDLVAEMKEQNRLKQEELALRREELELNRQMLAKGKPGRPPKQAEVNA